MNDQKQSVVYKGILIDLEKTNNRTSANCIIDVLVGKANVHVGKYYTFEKALEFAKKVIDSKDLSRINSIYGENKYVLLFGKKYNVKVFKAEKNGSAFNDNEFLVGIAPNCNIERTIINELYKHYYYQLKMHLLRIVPECEKKVNLQCSGWILCNTLYSWGSCKHRTKFIKFSIRLATQNFEFIETVVIHELGHILYNNHGKEFNEYMKRYVPNYRTILRNK